MHRAAQIEDWFQRRRQRRAVRRGRVPTIVGFTSYGSTEWVRVLARVVYLPETKKRKAQADRVRGWRSFTSVALSDAEVRIRINGTDVRLNADRGGVVDAKIPVNLEPGWTEVTLSSPGARTVTAPVVVISPKTKIGLLSDVDDTVMVTMLPRPFVAAWNAFVLDENARLATPGMAVLYERFVRSNPNAPVIYLSTGAWNVAPTLKRFLSRNLYPAGPLLLTDWGPTHDRLFRSGKLHKQESMRKLAEEFPNIQWVLVGDDGQHDLDLYTEFAKKHPNSVAAIAIREMSNTQAVLAGGRSHRDRRKKQVVPMVFGHDGAQLDAELTRIGVLKPAKGSR